MTIRPITSVSYGKNYNSLTFEGKKEDNSKKNKLSLNPVKKLAVPLAATVIAMSAPYANGKGLYSDTQRDYTVMNISSDDGDEKSSRVGKPLDAKLFDSSKIRVRPFDTDNDPSTAEKLVVEVSTFGENRMGVIESVGTGTVTVTGAYDSRSSELIKFNQSVVDFDNEDINGVLFDKQLHDYVMNFAQNKTNIKNNGAVKIENTVKDVNGSAAVGLNNKLIPHSWLKKAYEYQFNYEKYLGSPVWMTRPLESSDGSKFVIRGYNLDSNTGNYEILTIKKIPESEADVSYCTELEIKGFGLVNGKLYDSALTPTDFQYPTISLLCRGWDSTVTMVDVPIWEVVKQIHFSENGNNADLKVSEQQIQSIIHADGEVETLKQ